MNEVSELAPTLFLLQLAILFLPGVIWAHLDSKYASKKDDGQVWFLLRAFMFGIVSHGLTALVFWVVHQGYEVPNLFIADRERIITDRIGWQVLWATLIGFFLAILWMYLINFKVLTRFLQLIRATKTYGDEDVWEFVLNSAHPATTYVHVRDFENEIVDAGWVNVFSESERLRELVLVDVEIYDFDGEHLFDPPRVYLARKPENAHIEFPARPSDLAEA